MHRESKTFTEKEDAVKWMEEKTAENILALSNPQVYDQPLEKKMDKASTLPKIEFESEIAALNLFRSNSDLLNNKAFMKIFNAVADHERKPLMLKRYKSIIAGMRKEIKKHGSN